MSITLNTMKIWKCYRCDLTFKQEVHAEIHNDITKHPVQRIESIYSMSPIKTRVTRNPAINRLGNL
jgi:Zn-finger protein